ncbi:MAG: glycosyl transferase family 1 [Acidimicrobiaceae bacterium]|nr:glycosyl transferase family 1 [Acidimicrobiaceae bacterium]
MHTAVSAPPANPLEDRSRSFGILSTFPPTSCGIATFSAALAAGLIETGASVNVVRCGEPPEAEDVLVVAALHDPELDESARGAAALAALNANDVVIVQHEYGLYDGVDGDSVVALLAEIVVPIIVVAHTVLSRPIPNQRTVLEAVCDRADAIVVMTETARSRLVDGYDVDRSKVSVIPHGAATPSAGSGARRRSDDAPPRLLTWGLLGPGKGIEWAIDALDELDDVRPMPEYVVAGATHPKVRERQGEAYRSMLVDRVAASTSPIDVTFDDTYRDLASLNELIESADLVVLPYDSRDQVTSGVLVDAVAAGRPVVSTAFPHAVELLASGAGIVVPQRDPVALGQAIRSVLTQPGLAASMAAEARRLAPGLSWSAVARRYAALGDRVVTAEHSVAS